jgi:hypothetical protein
MRPNNELDYVGRRCQPAEQVGIIHFAGDWLPADTHAL